MKWKVVLTIAIVLVGELIFGVADWKIQNGKPDEVVTGVPPALLPTPSKNEFRDQPTTAHGEFQESPKESFGSGPAERQIASNHASPAFQNPGLRPASANNRESISGGNTGTVIGETAAHVQPSTITTPAFPSATATSASSLPPGTRLAAFPLAFREIPPEVAAANPQLVAAVQGLQQSFTNAVGGTNQNPADPDYYNRWVNAQRAADEQYRLLVGNQAFLAEQIKVNTQQASGQ